MSDEDKLGTPSRFTCPECQGPLWEIADPSMLRYRCHVGHAFTADSMIEAQAEEAEASSGSCCAPGRNAPRWRGAWRSARARGGRRSPSSSGCARGSTTRTPSWCGACSSAAWDTLTMPGPRRRLTGVEAGKVHAGASPWREAAGISDRRDRGLGRGDLGAQAVLLDDAEHGEVAFVVIMHLAPGRESALGDIIGRFSPLPTRVVEQDATVEPGHIYVIPPDAALRLEDGHLLTARPGNGRARGARSTASSTRSPRTTARTPPASSCPAPAATARSACARSRSTAASPWRRRLPSMTA